MVRPKELPDGDPRPRLRHFGRNAGHVAAHFSVYFDTIPAFGEKLADIPRPIPQTKLRELIRQAAVDPGTKGPFAAKSTDPEYLSKNGICVGTPEEVTRTIERYRNVGFDQLVLIPVIGWYTPHEKTMESIRLLGEQVLPAFQKS